MGTQKKHAITLGSFDLIKGFAIIWVVIAHTVFRYYPTPDSLSVIADSGISKVLTRFSLGGYTGFALIPMFLIITGYFFRQSSAKAMLKKTASTLLLPYYCVMLAYAIIYPLLYGITTDDWLKSLIDGLRYVAAYLLGFGTLSLSKSVFGFAVAWNTAGWYFIGSFVAINMLNLLLKIKNTKIQTVIVIAGIAIGYYLNHLTFCYFCLPQALLCLGFLYAGHIMKKVQMLQKLLSAIWIYPLFFVVLMAEAEWTTFDIYDCTTSHYVLDYIGVGISGVFLLLMGYHIGMCDWKVLDGIKQIGTHSYWILALHAAEMEAVPWPQWFTIPFRDRPWLGFLLELACKTVIYVVGCLLIKKISRYYYFKTRRAKLSRIAKNSVN